MELLDLLLPIKSTLSVIIPIVPLTSRFFVGFPGIQHVLTIPNIGLVCSDIIRYDNMSSDEDMQQ